MNLRAFVVEPQTIFTPFLSAALERAGLDVVGSCATLDTRAIAAEQPGVVLVDVDFFARGGTTALCRLRELFGEMPLVALSSSTDETHRASCYISGATLVCSKSLDETELVETIRTSLGTERAGTPDRRREKSGRGA